MAESNRRKVLAAGTAALLDGAGNALAGCERPARGPNADYFPNFVVVTHEKQQALFYDDLLRERTVLVNCFSIEHDAHYPVTANLAVVQDHLGERLGRDVFMYSLTTDPRHDTPEALARFARQHGARPGWLFLTGREADMEILRNRFFTHGRGVRRDHVRDCSMGLLRYGNESIGLWGAVPTKSDPEWIAHRLDWLVPGTPRSAPPRRRGPVPGQPFPGAIAHPTRDFIET